MSKKKLTFSLNYRRPKSEYKSSDELMICIRYYHKCSKTNKTKIIKKSTGVKCKLSDWNSDWHKSSKRNPIKDSDPNYKKKNNEHWMFHAYRWVLDFQIYHYLMISQVESTK